MKFVFADTSFYQALLNPRDTWHAAALEASRTLHVRVMTSEFVLCELGALAASVPRRKIFLELVQKLMASPHVEIAPASHELFERGLQLFSRRPDKDWSLTDCTSFVLMREHDIDAALCTDRHFEQAGFRLLLDK